MAWPVSSRFWAAQESLISSARSATRKGGARFGSSFARKEERWVAGGKRYLRGYGGLSARFQMIRVDPKLQALVMEELGRIAPALQGAFDEHLGRLAFAAWRRWPVATGLSKSLLALEYNHTADGTRFEGSIRSRAPYTVFIKGQPHRQLIDRVSLEVADRIGRDAAAAAAKGA